MSGTTEERLCLSDDLTFAGFVSETQEGGPGARGVHSNNSNNNKDVSHDRTSGFAAFWAPPFQEDFHIHVPNTAFVQRHLITLAAECWTNCEQSREQLAAAAPLFRVGAV